MKIPSELGIASYQSGKDDKFHYQKISKSWQSCLFLHWNIEMSVRDLCCIHKNSHGLLSSASTCPSKQHKVCCVVKRHAVTGARRATKKVKKKRQKEREEKASGVPRARMNTRRSFSIPITSHPELREVQWQSQAQLLTYRQSIQPWAAVRFGGLVTPQKAVQIILTK